MAVVRVNCNDCGVVEILDHEINALVVPGHPALSTMAFRCPVCGDPVIRTATPDQINRLIVGGIRVETLALPAELDEPHPDGRLGYDDLLDFALLLGSTDLLAEVAALEAQA